MIHRLSLAVMICLVAGAHAIAYASSLQPEGEVVAGIASNTGGDGQCGMTVAGMDIFSRPSGFRIFGNWICTANIAWAGGIGVRCAPDNVSKPCSGNGVSASFFRPVDSGLTGLRQVRVYLAAAMMGAAQGGIASGSVKVCESSFDLLNCQTPIPFQTLTNGTILLSLVGTYNATAPFVVVTLNIDSMPAGATLKITDFTVNFLSTAAGTGAVQVCKIGRAGILPGTPFDFNVEQIRPYGPPVSETLTVRAVPDTGSCSGNILFPKNSLIVVHEIVPAQTALAGIAGDAPADFQSATAMTLTGDSPVRLIFTNKRLGNEGCGPGYYQNHLNSSTVSMAAVQVSELWSQGPQISLLDALKLHGGPGLGGATDLLTRSSVTAWLNASNPDVAYALRIADVLQLASNAFASGDRETMLALSDKFNSLNSGAGGCPLN